MSRADRNAALTPTGTGRETTHHYQSNHTDRRPPRPAGAPRARAPREDSAPRQDRESRRHPDDDRNGRPTSATGAPRRYFALAHRVGRHRDRDAHAPRGQRRPVVRACGRSWNVKGRHGISWNQMTRGQRRSVVRACGRGWMAVWWRVRHNWFGRLDHCDVTIMRGQARVGRARDDGVGRSFTECNVM